MPFYLLTKLHQRYYPLAVRRRVSDNRHSSGLRGGLTAGKEGQKDSKATASTADLEATPGAGAAPSQRFYGGAADARPCAGVELSVVLKRGAGGGNGLR